jgi:hypothetical protein
MTESISENQIQSVKSFQDLITTPLQGQTNAIYWNRNLKGDFAEIVNSIQCNQNSIIIHPKQLRQLQLTEQGQLARDIILNDFKMLEEQGAAPILNIINNYERDDEYPFFPTDVYSYHVDRAPIATHTFLCTYYGATSDIIPNEQAIQKILIPEIRAELLKLYQGKEGPGFEDFLTEYFFDLHYQPMPNAQPINLGTGHLWKLAIDHPQSTVLPCVHRAPIENKDEKRLLLIC